MTKKKQYQHLMCRGFGEEGGQITGSCSQSHYSLPRVRIVLRDEQIELAWKRSSLPSVELDIVNGKYRRWEKRKDIEQQTINKSPMTITSSDNWNLPINERKKKIDNLFLLNYMKITQTRDEENYVNDEVLDCAYKVVSHLGIQPSIYKTFNNSIQMQFETDDGSYLEFEVFEDRMTCMLVPQRDYDKAWFPLVSINDYILQNQIIGKLYGLT